MFAGVASQYRRSCASFRSWSSQAQYYASAGSSSSRPKGTPPQMILWPSYTNGTRVRGLDMSFRFSFSDIFRVAHTYFMPSPSSQHCHRARLHPAHHPFAQPRLGVIIASESSTTVSFLFSATCWDLAPGRVNGSTSLLIHRPGREILSWNEADTMASAPDGRTAPPRLLSRRTSIVPRHSMHA